MKPSRFKIKNLYGNVNVDLSFKDRCSILVGPNGVGKSTVANLFYFLISRQWAKLTDYKFDEISLYFDNEVVSFKRDEITGLSRMEDLLSSISPSSRYFEVIEKLRKEGALEEFLIDFNSSNRAISSWRGRFDSQLSSDEFRHFLFNIRRRMDRDDDDLLSLPRRNVEAQLDRHLQGRTLYLPTYRRIEKDLRDISPEIGKKFGSSSSSEIELTRSSRYYVDLVSFGMNDVRERLSSLARELRDFSLAQFNNLSGIYLKDVIRGDAEDDDVSEIMGLTDGELNTILGRVSEHVLTRSDKLLLQQKIQSIREEGASRLDIRDRYLAHYFSRLIIVNKEISEREADILSFVETCNKYLTPRKEIVYDDTNFSTSVVDERSGAIDISMLSSGEKQVMSVFAHLYFDEAFIQTVIIDEPELSLSVPWQKRFLTDILNSGKCDFLLAVTHSPFVYQNELRPFATDLRRCMSFQ
ncbi:AAA family ATPase [Sulfitobacter sp. LCG007]